MDIRQTLLTSIPEGFSPSSRMLATLEGSYRSNGASCNFRSLKDDTEDILDCMRWAGLISQGQGAPTLDFTALRPAGSPVSSGGTSSGVLSFALMFDAVVSGMRRPGKKNSVGVAFLDVMHPEILDRVVEGSRVPGWLSAEADRQFKTVFRGVLIDPETWHLVPDNVRVAVAEAYNQYRIFICKYTTSSLGNRLNPNVCFPADQIAMTGKGSFKIADLIGRDHEAMIDGKPYPVPGGFFQTGVSEVYRLTTEEGYEVALTSNHRLLTETRGWVEARNLYRGEKVSLQSTPEVEWEGQGSHAEGYLMGHLLGNGTFSEGRATLYFWGETKESMATMCESFLKSLGCTYNRHFNRLVGRISIKSRDLTNIAAKYGIFRGKEDCAGVELQTSSRFYVGFLSGYFDTDGTINPRKPQSITAIQLTSKRKHHLQMVQRMLLRLGIFSRLRASTRLDISGKPNMHAFMSRVGFLHPIKSDQLVQGLAEMVGTTGTKVNTAWATFDRLHYRSTEPVYCATVDTVHTLNINGFTAHNCTEVRMISKGTCVLGAMNPAALRAEQLPAAMADAAKWMTRYYDEVALPIFRTRPDLFETEDPENRQVGLGLFGLANYIGRYGISYARAAQEIRKVLRGQRCDPAIAKLYEGYQRAADVFRSAGFVRAFTIQPTASTAYRALDIGGFNVAPEIQPPIGVRRVDGTVAFELKSELKGDQLCILPRYVETKDEVPYHVYRDLSEAYQEMLDATGLAHTLSHCYYGQRFTTDDLADFIASPLGSLYYRLPPVDLSQATQKAITWDDAGDLEIEDEDDTPTDGFCSADITQRKGYCSTCAGD